MSGDEQIPMGVGLKDAVFADTDEYPERWTSKKRGRKVKKGFKKLRRIDFTKPSKRL